MEYLRDNLNRPLRDLRVSVTDRCNFRCRYCMPREVFGERFRFLPHSAVLSFEEIARLCGLFVALGVEKIRLTGGEPLVRRDLERLVAMLAPLPGLRDLTLTTNGSLLAEKAAPLHAAGLHRLTVSLDSLDDAIFRRMSDTNVPVRVVLDGIRAAQEAGFRNVKVNMVVQEGVNDAGIEAMARYFHGTGITLRFIEYMDVGATNGWTLAEVVPATEILERVNRILPLEPIADGDRHAVARRYRYRDGGGEIGVIASVTRPFCRGCSRLRLSSEGALYTCLFAEDGHDLRALLRGGASDDALRDAIRAVWTGRADRYSELRHLQTVDRTGKIEMSRIGG